MNRSVADDFVGLARPQGGAYDIGAYEASQASPETPIVLVPAASSPPLVTGKTSLLSVSASDDGGAALLTYTWRLQSGAPAAAYFSRP
jgi:hypothetical protein